jgi:hypothetical protein
LDNPADYSVDGSQGLMTLPTAVTTRRALLNKVSVRDLDLAFRVATDRLPEVGGGGAGQFAYFVARHQATGQEYRGYVRFGPDGSVHLLATFSFDGEGSGELPLTQQELTAPGLQYVAGQYFWLRVQVVGTNPTTVQLKTWPDGAPEPADFPYVATDSQPLGQQAGSVGLMAYVSLPAANAPVTFRFDDLQVTDMAPTPVGQSATAVVAADSFSRTLTGSWGSADSGGPYSLLDNPADYSVDSSQGLMTLPTAATSHRALLTSVAVQDLDLRVRVATDHLPVVGGAGQFTYVMARHQAAGQEYRGYLRFDPDGSVHLLATFTFDGSGELPLAPEMTVAGLQQTGSQYFWLRVQVVGTNPTTVQLKTWPDGAPEPADFPYVATDSQPAVQQAGSIGLMAYVSLPAANAPVTFRFDDLQVTDLAP